MSDVLRIAHLTPYYWPHIGGVESVVQDLSEGFTRRGHEVHVITANRDQKGRFDAQCPHEEQINGVNVHRFRAYVKLGHYSLCPGIASFLMHHRFDILHSHCYRQPQGEIAALVGRHRNIPTILHGHGFFPSGPVKRILYGLYDQFAKRELLNQFDHFIVLTDSEKERFVALGVDPRKISVIPNGVDDECFQKIDPTAFRKKFGLTGKKVILFMGILKRIKRCDLLIRALPEIARRVPDVLVLLVGPDAGEYAKVKDIAEHLKVSNHFKWIGPLYGKEKHQAYSAADFLILPSDEEGFPRVLLEAMAHAKAVIGTDTVGSSAIILDQVTGFVTTRGSVEDIVTAALRLLTNPMLCEKMGRKARDVAIAKYQISQVVERLEALYYRLAAVKGNPKAQQLKA